MIRCLILARAATWSLGRCIPRPVPRSIRAVGFLAALSGLGTWLSDYLLDWLRVTRVHARHRELLCCLESTGESLVVKGWFAPTLIHPSTPSTLFLLFSPLFSTLSSFVQHITYTSRSHSLSSFSRPLFLRKLDAQPRSCTRVAYKVQETFGWQTDEKSRNSGKPESLK